MSDAPDPDRMKRWTWHKNDVEFDTDPDLPPLLTPEQREEARRQLALIRAEEEAEPTTDADLSPPPVRDRRIVRWRRRKY